MFVWANEWCLNVECFLFLFLTSFRVLPTLWGFRWFLFCFLVFKWNSVLWQISPIIFCVLHIKAFYQILHQDPPDIFFEWVLTLTSFQCESFNWTLYEAKSVIMRSVYTHLMVCCFGPIFIQDSIIYIFYVICWCNKLFAVITLYYSWLTCFSCHAGSFYPCQQGRADII